MSHAARTDLLNGNSLTEEFGRVVAATRVAAVSVDTATTTTNTGRIIRAALDYPTVPQPSEALGTDYPNVRMVRRSATIEEVQGTFAYVRVTCEYEEQLPCALESAFAVRGSASLNQVTTKVDRQGKPIELSYQPVDENGVATGALDTIRAEVDVFEVRGHFQRSITEVTNDPEERMFAFISKVNANTFHNSAPGEWLCTNVEYELQDRYTDPKRYAFSYEFEYSKDGHKYTVAYKDKDDRIPKDVVEDVGIVDVEWHDPVDFPAVFDTA